MKQIGDNIVRHFLEIQALRVAMNNHIKQMGRDKRPVSGTTTKVFALLEEAEKLICKSEMEGYINTDPVAREVWEQWGKGVGGVGKNLLAQIMLIANKVPGRHVSSLWKFCGMAVEDGKAPRHVGGQKSTYNPVARMICFKIGDCLIKGNKGAYRAIYDETKIRENTRARAEGLKVIPSASIGKKKAGTYRTEGHIHNRARRRMVKRLLSDLWVVWSAALGPEFRKMYGHDPAGPYAGRLEGHTISDPKVA